MQGTAEEVIQNDIPEQVEPLEDQPVEDEPVEDKSAKGAPILLSRARACSVCGQLADFSHKLVTQTLLVPPSDSCHPGQSYRSP